MVSKEREIGFDHGKEGVSCQIFSCENLLWPTYVISELSGGSKKLWSSTKLEVAYIYINFTNDDTIIPNTN